MPVVIDTKSNILFIRQDSFLGAMKELETVLEASIVTLDSCKETTPSGYDRTFIQITMENIYDGKQFDLLVLSICVRGFQTEMMFFDPRNRETCDDSEEMVLATVFEKFCDDQIRKNLQRKADKIPVG